MRQADIDEVAAASDRSSAEALIYSLRQSHRAWVGIIDGVPEVMFGVGYINVLAGVAAPWLLATDAVEHNFIGFLRRSVQWRSQLLARYPVLTNFVDERNTVSIRWLEWLGFKLSDPIDVRGHKFRAFELRQANV